jgi:hypothetical protein
MFSDREGADMVQRDLLALSTVADRLQLTGRDRERSVLRRLRRHGVPFIRWGRGAYFVTEQQYDELIEKITVCSPSGNEANISTSVARSVSGGRRASSKSILQEQIAAKLQTRTDQNLKPKSATKSFTVVEGGRTP